MAGIGGFSADSWAALLPGAAQVQRRWTWWLRLKALRVVREGHCQCENLAGTGQGLSTLSLAVENGAEN